MTEPQSLNFLQTNFTWTSWSSAPRANFKPKTHPYAQIISPTTDYILPKLEKWDNIVKYLGSGKLKASSQYMLVRTECNSSLPRIKYHHFQSRQETKFETRWIHARNHSGWGYKEGVTVKNFQAKSLIYATWYQSMVTITLAVKRHTLHVHVVKKLTCPVPVHAAICKKFDVQ